jgi:hypothetical protein
VANGHTYSAIIDEAVAELGDKDFETRMIKKITNLLGPEHFSGRIQLVSSMHELQDAREV